MDTTKNLNYITSFEFLVSKPSLAIYTNFSLKSILT